MDIVNVMDDKYKMFSRYYNAPPEKKDLTMCFRHGQDHAGYRWNKQIDPRWNQDQIDAYLEGYKSNAQEDWQKD